MMIYGNGQKMELPTYARDIRDYGNVVIVTAIATEMGKTFVYRDIMALAEEYITKILGKPCRIIADSNYGNGNGLINYSFTF